MAAKRDEADCARIWRAVADAQAEGRSRAEVARALGMKPNSLTGWLRANPLPEVIPDAAPKARRVEQDAAFWRKRAQEEAKRVDQLQRLLDMLHGVADQEPAPPVWARRESGGRRRSALLANVADLHFGEVVAADAIQGVNAYDPAIAQARFRRYFDAACEIGARWTADTDCAGVLLALLGDLVSGDIHDELSKTNALTSHEAVLEVVEMTVAAIRLLLTAFPAVHVTAVPGNHGRLTRKTEAKLAARASYDTLIAAMARRELRGEARVTWAISAGTSVSTQVFSTPVLDLHGDRIGTGGGLGFVGPVLPLARGGKKVADQQASFGRPVKVMRMGHWHYACEPQRGQLCNGSFPGYSEYGDGLRVGFDPPSQKLALVTEKWGLRERLDVILEEPAGGPAADAPHVFA